MDDWLMSNVGGGHDVYGAEVWGSNTYGGWFLALIVVYGCEGSLFGL